MSRPSWRASAWAVRRPPRGAGSATSVRLAPPAASRPRRRADPAKQNGPGSLPGRSVSKVSRPLRLDLHRLDLLRLGFFRDLQRERLHGGLAAGRQGLVALGGDALEIAQVGAGACRNEPADDDVLLQALQAVRLAMYRGVGEHTGGFLERRRRDEAARLQR